MVKIDLHTFKKRSSAKSAENKKFLRKQAEGNPRDVDDAFHQMHEAVFQEIDCLDCANCCKTTSPIFYQTDIDRLARHFRIRPGELIEKYLRVDEDKDYVLKSSPCPFLLDDNRCEVYDSRPKACREYPHTDRKKMVQIMDLTHKNTLVCPAVFEMVERLKLIK